MALPKLRTTAPARSSCTCPLCAGTTTGADGVYHCRAGKTVEYSIYVNGEYRGSRPTFLAAETELNKLRRDALTAPVELAAAEADLDAQAAEYVAEQDVCDTCGEPASHPIHRDDSDDGHEYLPGWDEIHREWAADIANGEAAADMAAYDVWIERINSVPGVCYCGAPIVGGGCVRDDCMNFAPPAEILPFTPEHSPLDPNRPRPTPPAISYSVRFGGFTWAGALYVYPTYLAADEARAEWLETPPRGMLLAA